MRLFAFSDWRAQEMDPLLRLIRSKKPDAVIYAGDDLDRFIALAPTVLLRTRSHSIPLDTSSLRPVNKDDLTLFTPGTIELLQAMKSSLERFNTTFIKDCGVPFHFVNGNDDPLVAYRGQFYQRVAGDRFWSEHTPYRLMETKSGRITAKQSFMDAFTSSDSLDDAGLFTPIAPSFGPFSLKGRGRPVSVLGIGCHYGLESDLAMTPNRYADLWISHLPPYGSLDLSVRFGTEHIGSLRLRRAIQRFKPKMVISGHSHFWGGSADRIGPTAVLNLSSDDRPESPGNYAIVDTADWSYSIDALKSPNFFQIRGMRSVHKAIRNLTLTTPDRATALSAQKEFVSAFMSASSSIDRKIRSLRRLARLGISTQTVQNRVRSLRIRKPVISRRFTLNPAKCGLVDVETGLAKGNIPGELWLVGLYHADQFLQFRIPEERREFIRYLKENDVRELASWTTYDHESLRPMLDAARLNVKFVDACQRTANSVIWHTYKLHDFHGALLGSPAAGVESISGRMAGIYADHLILPGKSCRHCPPPGAVIDSVKERNRIDVLKMLAVCKYLYQGKG